MVKDQIHVLGHTRFSVDDRREASGQMKADVEAVEDIDELGERRLEAVSGQRGCVARRSTVAPPDLSRTDVARPPT